MKTKNGDWIIKQRRKIFENDFFKVFEDDVVQPDGKDGKYATIDFPPGVSILPADENEYVYLTRQFRYALERENIEAVSGAVEDEEILDAARRELREEIGIEAGEWIELGKIESDTSITNSTAHLFLARNLTFHDPDREGTEQIETLKMSLQDAFEKVMNGEITHAQTCALVLKAYFLLEEKKRR